MALCSCSSKSWACILHAVRASCDAFAAGSLVLLSDGTLALVMSSEPSSPLKPCVLPFTKGRVQEGVDLINLKDDDRTITKVVDFEELTPPQREFFSLGKHYCYYFSTFTSPEAHAIASE